MGITSDFYIEFFEPRVDPEEEKKHLEQEMERETHFWEVQCAGCPIDSEEKRLLVKQKCARVTQRL